MPHVPRDHRPSPYGVVPYGGGVRCSCGADFAIGDPFPDTRTQKRSKKLVTTMRQAWQLFRLHAYPPETAGDDRGVRHAPASPTVPNGAASKAPNEREG